MKVPISKNWLSDAEFQAVLRPLRDGWLVQGPRVREFENAFSAFTSAPFALACSSGTAALHIAVTALKLKPGDEVIVPAFTWVATANVVELTGACPVFCDVDLQTFNLDVRELESLVTSRTVGIIPVHLFGLCAEMDAVIKFAQRHAIWVIEDAACALGSMYRDRSAGLFGDIGCFSFHPRKSITTGEGGMLTLRDEALARRCEGLRNHGAMLPATEGKGGTGHTALLPQFDLAGFNYRLTDIQGALGNAQMRRLEFLLAERQRCADFYSQALRDLDWLRLPFVPLHQRHSWQSYTVLFAPKEPSLGNVAAFEKERNRMMKELETAGISTRQGTHSPPHLNYYRERYRIRTEDFPTAWMAERLTIALPVFPGITEDELHFVSDKIHQFN